jgi:predicted ATPase
MIERTFATIAVSVARHDEVVVSALPAAPFVHAVRLREWRLDERGRGDYSDDLPALAGTERIPLHPHVTFLVGENGSGKSTLVEAIAVAAKLNAEGGGHLQQFAFSTRTSHSALHRRLELERAKLRPLNAFFLRAESVYNVATELERPLPKYELQRVFARPLHEQSHGESFLDIAVNRLGPRGFYIFDEPEAALSANGQLALMRRIHELVREHSQLVVATHSPILLGYPDAAILMLDDDGIREIGYDEAPQVELTRAFLRDREQFLRHLLGE